MIQPRASPASPWETVQRVEMSDSYRCPCCGYWTLSEEPPGTFVICPVCSWEDDRVQYDDPSYEGGANGTSLNQARANFQRFGAAFREDLSRVRPPLEDELHP